MALLLGQFADSIYKRQGGLKIGKLVSTDDVMFIDDFPLRRLRQQTMKAGKILSFYRWHTAAARNAVSLGKPSFVQNDSFRTECLRP